MTQPKKVILSELLGSDMIEPMPIKEHLYGSDYNFQAHTYNEVIDKFNSKDLAPYIEKYNRDNGYYHKDDIIKIISLNQELIDGGMDRLGALDLAFKSVRKQ